MACLLILGASMFSKRWFRVESGGRSVDASIIVLITYSGENVMKLTGVCKVGSADLNESSAVEEYAFKK